MTRTSHGNKIKLGRSFFWHWVSFIGCLVAIYLCARYILASLGVL